MNILKSILNELDLRITDVPPEIGGILGCRNGEDVISEVVFDRQSDGYSCGYRPNVEFFNQVIEEWTNRDIAFVGLFHTHFFGVKTLSAADEEYIRTIICAMPSDVERLYFPIFVLPDRTLIAYLAERKNGNVDIRNMPVEII